MPKIKRNPLINFAAESGINRSMNQVVNISGISTNGAKPRRFLEDLHRLADLRMFKWLLCHANNSPALSSS